MSDSPPTANILVVDDTIENLRLLANILGGQGYEIRPVTSGRQAIQAAEHDPPDLILLDITMPQMDGFEVCTRLKENAATRDIPVIFLTALTETADKVRAFDVGGVDFVTKPFQFEEVLARVKTHIALRRSQRDLHESYEKLRAVEKLRDQLVHMVVHDMRSPLMALTMNLQFLQESIESTIDEQPAADLRLSIRAAESLGRMANELLDVNRLEEGKMPLKLASADLVALAREASKRLGGMDRERTLEVSPAHDVHSVCDAGLVGRVIENLVGNAIKHTPAGGRIRIVVDATASGVRVSVHDQGRGVPVEAREKIFEKFGAVEVRDNNAYHSVGLGLAFCKLVVAAHGGTIDVDPGKDGGSVFWFEIPAPTI